jgi:hypothetical protein
VGESWWGKLDDVERAALYVPRDELEQIKASLEDLRRQMPSPLARDFCDLLIQKIQVATERHQAQDATWLEGLQDLGLIPQDPEGPDKPRG